MQELLQRYRETVLPFLPMFPANSCIELSRLLVECLGPRGIPTRTVECVLQVYCQERELLYVSGASKTEMAKLSVGAASVESRYDPKDDDRGGHVVVIAGDESEWYLVDSALAQASEPKRGFILEPDIIIIGPCNGNPYMIHAGAHHGDDTLDIRWRLTYGRSFEKTDAWEPSHLWPLIHLINYRLNRKDNHDASKH